MKNKIKNIREIRAKISQDETERITANSYLVEKLNQGRKGMEDDKGTKISLEGLWSIKF